jgi:hypothetical protein
VLSLSFYIPSYAQHPVQIDDWRDIAMPKDHMKPTRERILGVNATLLGFGQESMEKVYSDTGTYVVTSIIKIMIAHLSFHGSCCHTYVLLNVMITVLRMINRKLETPVSQKSALQASCLMKMACLTMMMKGA